MPEQAFIFQDTIGSSPIRPTMGRTPVQVPGTACSPLAAATFSTPRGLTPAGRFSFLPLPRGGTADSIPRMADTHRGWLVSTGAMSLLFLALKLTGVIDWSWWWVTAPLWMAFGVVIGLLLLVALFDFGERRRWRR